MKKKRPETYELTDRTETRIRFSEVDALGIVWHGNFVKYLEDGRESFGRNFGLGYQEVYDHGLLTPLVDLKIDFLQRVSYGEVILIETSFVNSPAAKIIFDYRILRKEDGVQVLRARTTQVFTNLEGELELSNPPFYRNWKKKYATP
jgi:acyl-CoA thioester hydrolase